jgi:hypothetical protein
MDPDVTLGYRGSDDGSDGGRRCRGGSGSGGGRSSSVLAEVVNLVDEELPLLLFLLRKRKIRKATDTSPALSLGCERHAPRTIPARRRRRVRQRSPSYVSAYTAASPAADAAYHVAARLELGFPLGLWAGNFFWVKRFFTLRGGGGRTRNGGGRRGERARRLLL